MQPAWPTARRCCSSARFSQNRREPNGVAAHSLVGMRTLSRSAGGRVLLSRHVRLWASGLWLIAACAAPERSDAGAEPEDGGVEEAGELDGAAQDAAEGEARDAELAAAPDVSAPDGAASERPDAAGDGAVVADAAQGGDSGVRDPGSSGDGDSTLKTYPVQPELTDKGAPKGRSFRFSMDSSKSTIFDGQDATLNPQKPRLLTRQIDVYVPARYRD